MLNGSLTLCVTTEILEEYTEIISQKLGSDASEAVLSVSTNLPNVDLITRYYRWFTMTNDPDDDKFVDYAVAGGAALIITDDTHFRVLKSLAFPKIEAMTVIKFAGYFQDNRWVRFIVFCVTIVNRSSVQHKKMAHRYRRAVLAIGPGS